MMFDNVTNAPTAPFGVFDPNSSNILAPGLTGFVLCRWYDGENKPNQTGVACAA